MVKCYISLSLDNGEITSISNIKDGSCTIEAELVDPMFDFSKLIGYKFDGKTLSFDQNKWNAHVAEQNRQEAIKNGEAMLDKLAEQSILENADDATSYAMRYLYPEWNPEGVNYFKDKWPNRVIFDSIKLNRIILLRNHGNLVMLHHYLLRFQIQMKNGLNLNSQLMLKMHI